MYAARLKPKTECMVKRLFSLLIILLTSASWAQTWTLAGKVTGNGEALPFASVYIKGTTKGVNSNDEGRYALKLLPGRYTLVFQYVGYSKRELPVDISGDQSLDVDLRPDGIALSEVVVKAGEDPAYPIMRKAIKKKKQYKEPLEAYSCQSYIKGLQRLLTISDKLKKLIKFTAGETVDSTMLGVIYLSESESNYYFEKPNKEKEVMYSSRVSGDGAGFSYNQLHEMKMNFYENTIDLLGFGARPFVSPLNSNAFLYYKFRLLGTVTEDNKVINKIYVRPKRKNDPCFTGVIYIQDSTWRLTGLDLRLTKDNKIRFVDTLDVRQLYAPVVADSIWMPVNYNFSFDFSFMGIRANGYFNAIVKNYDPNPRFDKNTFSNEIMVIEDGANKKDSAYWAQNRPVPLTVEERSDYRKKDSTEKITSTDRYKDSVDHKHNRFRTADVFLGYTYTRTKDRLSVSIPGILTSGVQYNTVEGLNLSYKFSVNKEYEDNRSKWLSGRLRYGFSNLLWGGELSYASYFNPKRFANFSLAAKSIVEQYNKNEPIAPLVNTGYTLLDNHNYMKLYKETGLEANYFSEVVNGIYFKSAVSYFQRDALRNSTDLLLIDNPNRLFTSNDPQNENSDQPAFRSNRSLTAELSFTFRFHQTYVSAPNQKIITGSRYPKLVVSYLKAVPALGADMDYDLASASVNDAINLGLFGRFAYRFKGGYFLNRRRMEFMDYAHFLGNQTLINTNDYLNSFRLLPYYRYSTNNWFAEGHAEHHFNGFIFNKIPLLKKLSIQEVVGGHLLMNDRLEKYFELNFGLENIFNVVRIDYVLGYGINNRVNSGFTIGVNGRF